MNFLCLHRCSREEQLQYGKLDRIRCLLYEYAMNSRSALCFLYWYSPYDSLDSSPTIRNIIITPKGGEIRLSNSSSSLDFIHTFRTVNSTNASVVVEGKLANITVR